jgi:disulfide bond formation protein DsbB
VAIFFVALVALVGSLYLTLGLGLQACPLCLYQRSFVMGVVGVLGVGMLAKVRPIGSAGLLALPLAVAGASVGVLHVYLQHSGKLECPAGILGWGTAPEQALAVQSLLTLLLIVAVLRTRGTVPLLGAVLLGLAFAVASIRTAPPAKQPTAPYAEELKGCRPPYGPAP